MEEAKVLHTFFVTVFIGKTCFQQSHVPETRRKVWSQQSLPSVEEDQVKEHLNTLNIHRSMAPMLRELADGILKPLLIIFEMLWVLWEVPKAWKKANVIPIFKKVRHEDYRLVRHTSIPRKMIDHVILEAISKHIKDKNVTGRSQHGFMRDILSDQPDEVTTLLDKEKNSSEILFALALARLLSLFPITSLNETPKYGLDNWTVK